MESPLHLRTPYHETLSGGGFDDNALCHLTWFRKLMATCCKYSERERENASSWVLLITIVGRFWNARSSLMRFVCSRLLLLLRRSRRCSRLGNALSCSAAAAAASLSPRTAAAAVRQKGHSGRGHRAARPRNRGSLPEVCLPSILSSGTIFSDFFLLLLVKSKTNG